MGSSSDRKDSNAVLLFASYRMPGAVSQESEPRRTDTASTMNPESLASLFALLPDNQHDADLVRMIGAVGVGNKVRKYAVKLAQQEAVVGMCRSFATRQHCAKLLCSRARAAYVDGEALESRPGIASILTNLVSEEDARAFQRDDGCLRKSLLQDASTWFEALRVSGALGKDGALTSSINKKAIQKALGRLEKSNSKLSNKTCTEPGPGEQPRVSTYGTTVPFDKLVLREWLTHVDNPAKGDDPTKGVGARTVAVEFAALLVVRSLTAGRPGVAADEKFTTVWKAMDANGLLKPHLERAPTSLKIGDDSFFGKQQLAIISRSITKNRNGDSTGGYNLHWRASERCVIL